MSWHLGRLAAFDLETTGPDPLEARIVTAAISVCGGDLLDEPHDWLIDPGVEIPAGATAVHGISTEKARAEGTEARTGIDQIIEVLAEHLRNGIPIVAFNARFDMTVLDREARRHGLEPLAERIGPATDVLVIDPHVIDKKVDRYRRGKRTLTACCAHYGVVLEDAHTADADAAAAAALVRCIADRFEELATMSAAELHRAQIEWAAEQARSLQEYFESQGRSERVEPAWPLVPALQPA